MFVIGNQEKISQELIEEQKQHNDLYYVDCPDDYLSLSLKVHTYIYIYKTYSINKYFTIRL